MKTNEQKLGQEAAFPCEHFPQDSTVEGMSKRFYAACQIAPSVINAILSSEKAVQRLQETMINFSMSQESVLIGIVYEYVDELLKQENK